MLFNLASDILVWIGRGLPLQGDSNVCNIYYTINNFIIISFPSLIFEFAVKLIY